MRFLLVAALLFLSSTAVDTSAAPQATGARPFQATAVPHRLVNSLPPPGRTGNRDLLHWIINDRHGRPFGIATLECSWYRGRERMCVGVFRLARGSFAVSGSGQTRTVGEFIVTSGTGAYAATHGTLQYNATSRGKLVLQGYF